jgi:hypothetical protein
MKKRSINLEEYDAHRIKKIVLGHRLTEISIVSNMVKYCLENFTDNDIVKYFGEGEVKKLRGEKGRFTSNRVQKERKVEFVEDAELLRVLNYKTKSHFLISKRSDYVDIKRIQITKVDLNNQVVFYKEKLKSKWSKEKDMTMNNAKLNLSDMFGVPITMDGYIALLKYRINNTNGRSDIKKNINMSSVQSDYYLSNYNILKRDNRQVQIDVLPKTKIWQLERIKLALNVLEINKENIRLLSIKTGTTSKKVIDFGFVPNLVKELNVVKEKTEKSILEQG